MIHERFRGWIIEVGRRRGRRMSPVVVVFVVVVVVFLVLPLIRVSPPPRAQRSHDPFVVVHVLRGGKQARGDGLDVLHLRLVVGGVRSSGVALAAAEARRAQERLQRAPRAPAQVRGVAGEDHERARREDRDRGDQNRGG